MRLITPSELVRVTGGTGPAPTTQPPQTTTSGNTTTMTCPAGTLAITNVLENQVSVTCMKGEIIEKKS